MFAGLKKHFGHLYPWVKKVRSGLPDDFGEKSPNCVQK